MKEYNNTPVLVTGAEGFIGSALVHRLAREGARVSAEVHPSAPRDRLTGLEDTVRIYSLDIRDRAGLVKMAEESPPRKIFHLAAMTDVGRGWEKIEEALSVNLGGTVNLLSALSRVDHEIVIAACTAEAYGRNPAPFKEEMPLDPISPYSFSKAAATLFCRMAAASLGVSIRILRLFLVYGPGQGEERFLPQVIRAGLTGAPIRMTAGEQTREYTYIDDAVEGFLMAAKDGPGGGEVFNLGTGEEVSLRELVALIDSMMEGVVRVDPEVLPYRENEIRRFVGDHRKFREAFGWAPAVSLKDGLEETISWYRHNPIYK
ncbi:MAG: NAD-dependent epimerase/dehydratase family protein [PVC group bacterium]